MAARPVDPDQLEDVAAESDERDGERVDRDLEGQDDRVLGVRADERRRAAGVPSGAARSSDDEVGRDELADEPADRAPGEAGPGDELRPRQRAALVQLADDRAQVRPADGLAALADASQRIVTRFVFLSFKCLC